MLTGRVVVTGGTGFIGGRIVERLALETSATVRVLVRSFSSASRIARFPVEIVQVDLEDQAAVENAVSSADVVIHAALDAADLTSNLRAADNLARGCLAGNVSRLVHLSTFSVYEPLPAGDLAEDSPRAPCGSPYADVKLEIEQLFSRMFEEQGLPVTVIQPTIVYGPFGGTWTDDPVYRLRRGRVILPDYGAGLCNAVYVDDVVSAAFCAAQTPEAVGDRFLVSWKHPVTWRQFFEAYERLLGIQSLEFMPSEAIEKSIDAVGPLATMRRLGQDPHRILDYGWARALYRQVRTLVGEKRWSIVRSNIPPHVAIPDAGRLELFRSQAAVKIDHAQRVLGWAPEFDLARGMRLTGDYIRWARL